MQLTHAYHEWAIVEQALARGAQSILLRKGGIAERKGRFTVETPRFAIYPTFTHQQLADLKPQWAGTLPDSTTPEGRERLALWVEVDSVWALPSDPEAWSLIDRFHIYSPSLIEKRCAYKPDRPLYLLLARVYRIDPPVEIDEPRAHHVCRSWVPLDPPIDVDRSHPVIDDETFERLKLELGPLAEAGASHVNPAR